MVKSFGFMGRRFMFATGNVPRRKMMGRIKSAPMVLWHLGPLTLVRF